MKRRLSTAAILAAALLVAMTVIVSLLPASLTTKDVKSYGLPAELSEPTVRDIEQYMGRWKNLANITVLSLDFQHNKRVTVFSRTPNQAIAKIMEQRKAVSPGTGRIAPIFSANKLQNEEMQVLLSGSFACFPGSQSIYAQNYGLEDTIVTSCRTPIDPSTGRIVGYLVLHFIVPPLTEAERKQIQQDTQVLATTIYFNEIVPVRD